MAARRSRRLRGVLPSVGRSRAPIEPSTAAPTRQPSKRTASPTALRAIALRRVRRPPPPRSCQGSSRLPPHLPHPQDVHICPLAEIAEVGKLAAATVRAFPVTGGGKAQGLFHCLARRRSPEGTLGCSQQVLVDLNRRPLPHAYTCYR